MVLGALATGLKLLALLPELSGLGNKDVLLPGSQ